MRNAWAYSLLCLAIALALPAMLLSFVAEKLSDMADDHLD
jgi:hypothetical protein